jgi:hypothetical protein
MICEKQVTLPGRHGVTTMLFRRRKRLLWDPVIDVTTWFGGLQYVGTSQYNHPRDECNAVEEVQLSEDSGLVLIICLGGENIQLRSPDRNKHIWISHASIGHQRKSIVVHTEDNIQLNVPKFERIFVVLGPCVILENDSPTRIPTSRKVLKPVSGDGELSLDSGLVWGPVVGQLSPSDNGTIVVIDSKGKNGIAIEIGEHVVFDENVLFTSKPGSFYITVSMTVSSETYTARIVADKAHTVTHPCRRSIRI